MQWPARRMATQGDKSFGMMEVASKLIAKGSDDIIHLEFGRPSFDTPLHIKEAAKRALDRGVVHYGDLQGNMPLREALSEKLARHNGLKFGADEIIVTNGLTEAAFATFMAALNDGDEVIFIDPYYPQHNKKAELVGGVPVIASLDKANGFRLDVEAIRARITPKTRMVSLVNPANPVGRVFTREELLDLAALVEEHDLLVMTDEVYEYIVFDGQKHISFATLPGMRERTVSTFAFTKAYAMDGWRLGYLAADRRFIEDISKVILNLSTHPNVFAQHGALAATVESQDCLHDMVAEDQRCRDLVCARLPEIPGVRLLKPEGTIYAFPDFSAWCSSSQALAREILTHTRVAVEAGGFYGPSGEGHLRICFGSEPYHRVAEAMDRLVGFFVSRSAPLSL